MLNEAPSSFSFSKPVCLKECIVFASLCLMFTVASCSPRISPMVVPPCQWLGVKIQRWNVSKPTGPQTDSHIPQSPLSIINCDCCIHLWVGFKLKRGRKRSSIGPREHRVGDARGLWHHHQWLTVEGQCWFWIKRIRWYLKNTCCSRLARYWSESLTSNTLYAVTDFLL